MGPHYSTPSIYGWMNGKLDDVRIYNRALTATDVAQLYTAAGSAPTTYTISAVSSPAAAGTVNGGGTFTSGSSVTMTASASAGYTFFNWTESGTVVSTSPSYTFTASASRNLIANFTPIPCSYALSPTSASFGSASPSWSFNVTAGTGCSWTAAS